LTASVALGGGGIDLQPSNEGDEEKGRPNPSAASGSIIASPGHLALDEGAQGVSVITWSTSGTRKAQVYVSANGGAEQLFAQGVAGSQEAPWIRAPGYYVFSLYGDFSRINLLDYVAVTTQESPASHFGVNYWPATCQGCLLDDGTAWIERLSSIQVDLDHLASLGVRSVRLLGTWPHTMGWTMQPGNPVFDVFAFDRATNHFVEIVRECQRRNLAVIVDFANTGLLRSGTDPADPQWWELAYGPAGWSDFMAHSREWISGLVGAIEQDASHDSVLYYDIQNEASQNMPLAWEYVNRVLDADILPKGKRGLSVRFVQECPYYCDPSISDTRVLSQELAGRHLEYIDFHSYPRYPANPDIETCLEWARSDFPDAAVLMGEFGRLVDDSVFESDQQVVVLDLVDRAIAAELSYYLHFLQWDLVTANGRVMFGLGAGPHEPRDVLGGLTEKLSDFPNADMEAVSGGVPVGWVGSGTVPEAVEFKAMYPTDDAATNQTYARIKIAEDPGGPEPVVAWICSSVVSASDHRRLFVNGYIRSNMEDVRLTVPQYDSSGFRLETPTGPGFDPQGWSWNHYLERVGSWHAELWEDTARLQVCVRGQAVRFPAYLDLDTVSMKLIK
jgi:hypothetical protein